MTRPSSKTSPVVTPYCHTYSNSSSNVSTPRSDSPHQSPPASPSTFAKPFDRFRPLGGGADGDIFRRFNIQKSEEERFILRWVRQPHSPGFLARDDSGTLVFRVSSSDISALSALGIGHSDSQIQHGIEWTNVYDKHGISWLTRHMGAYHLPPAHDIHIYHAGWEHFIRHNNGIIGRYGPSGLTTEEFRAVEQISPEEERSKLPMNGNDRDVWSFRFDADGIPHCPDPERK